MPVTSCTRSPRENKNSATVDKKKSKTKKNTPLKKETKTWKRRRIRLKRRRRLLKKKKTEKRKQKKIVEGEEDGQEEDWRRRRKRRRRRRRRSKDYVRSWVQRRFCVWFKHKCPWMWLKWRVYMPLGGWVGGWGILFSSSRKYFWWSVLPCIYSHAWYITRMPDKVNSRRFGSLFLCLLLYVWHLPNSVNSVTLLKKNEEGSVREEEVAKTTIYNTHTQTHTQTHTHTHTHTRDKKKSVGGSI